MLKELIDFAFPATCLLCGSKPKPLCDQCVPVFESNKDQDGVFFAIELDQKALAIFSAIKDRNRTSLIKHLAQGLGPCLSEAISDCEPTLLVCPPSSKSNFRKRGFNPAKEIFRAAAIQPIALTDSALSLRFQPRDQRSLGALQRAQNTVGRYSSRVHGERVLLVDDVMTTGATLKAAELALEQSECEVVGKCVVARRFANSTHEILN